MHGFVRDLITEWRRLRLPTSGTVVIGVSGGADSVSLLLAMHELWELKKLDVRIIAAHYNHHLRGSESDADEEFVSELTAARKMEFAVGHDREIEGRDLEQKARVARYGFLSKTAENIGAFAVLTGHTMNDQAETFLINLLRGSGPNGLCGMRPVRPLNVERTSRSEGSITVGTPEKSECDITTANSTDLLRQTAEATSPLLPFASSPILLVRPMLAWAKRLHTEGYCRDKGVEYRYDTMNEDTAFKRVRIRKILLPLLEDFNPNIVETLARTASLMQGVSNPIADRDEDTLEIAELRAMSPQAMYETLRSWLGQKRGGTRSISLKHIQAIERLVRSQKSGRIAELPGKASVIRSNGRLTYRGNSVD